MSKKLGNWSLVGSGLMFGLYCFNVAIGKISLVASKKPFFSMGDVGEFLVLFAAVIFLVVAMLDRETQSKTK